MGQQESRTLPPLPQQHVIRLNPDGTSTEVVLNPAGSAMDTSNASHCSRTTPVANGEQLTPVAVQAYVDRASFRVGDGKVLFTLICSADAMVTVYMNAMNKYNSASSSRGRRRLQWPVLSYEHSQSKRVSCTAPNTRTTLEFDLEPSTVMLKAMSEQHWPLIIEVFVAATQSSTLMYLSPTDSHATNVTVSEQIHKLPNGTVVATGALYGLADITKNGDGKTRDTCSICLTNPINTALLPCGHTALCSDCARLLQQDPVNSKCPICRARVISSVTLDLA
ncbi:RING domain protein, putative [Perkinsus marinus ATCC 50983]|uniref:RING domain protein, putative n=1 Tax=Perkinsus marinus (strain ATCC 50983 / TXsc) TaxID=423536 RepID=C5L867_PERM5|nr:RING domain protein, putative [Perkinsus marinus ATCC 50983]EER07093.1 RING domain protein, putative [Perkinsus marinus ATCC 50983]|eukprot:XP_002775277.1 RING domain protein, putative [Perkinsus marinus ATCC 50983]